MIGRGHNGMCRYGKNTPHQQDGDKNRAEVWARKGHWLFDGLFEFADKCTDILVGIETDNDFSAAFVVLFDTNLLRKEFFEQILEVLNTLGGGVNDVR